MKPSRPPADPYSTVLVLVDLHDHGSDGIDVEKEFPEALENCRWALAHARRYGFPVAFTRRLEQKNARAASSPEPSWLSGFLPCRTEMVFDRFGLSCYASPAFAEMTDHGGKSYVLAGLFAATTCLSTVIDGSLRRHRILFLGDASGTRTLGRASPELTHQIMVDIIGLHVEVTDTKSWIQASAPTPLRLVASAGDPSHGE